jgi:hypothetical protein
VNKNLLPYAVTQEKSQNPDSPEWRFTAKGGDFSQKNTTYFLIIWKSERTVCACNAPYCDSGVFFTLLDIILHDSKKHALQGCERVHLFYHTIM